MVPARLVCFLVGLVLHVASGGRTSAGEAVETAQQNVEVADQQADEVEDPDSPDTGLEPIDWTAVKAMKKSAIWAFVEEREEKLKESIAEMNSRKSQHGKESRQISKDFKAVKAKFDGLRAAQGIDKKEIMGLEAEAKSQKNDIKKLKS